MTARMPNFLVIGAARSGTTSLVSARYNDSFVPKSQTLNVMLSRPNPVKSALKFFVRGRAREKLSRFLKKKNQTALPLDEKTRQDLRSAYRDDILKLQGLIQKSLSAWLA